MRTSPWVLVPAAIVSSAACATSYLSLEQAQQAIFPGAALDKAFVLLTPEQQREIERRSGVPVPRREVRAWRVAGGGYFMLDEVLGKHELITYALGLNADGSVREIEILDYRESYGGEIRNPNWRRQFTGRTAADPLRLDRDIRTISGATMSCRHVTEGVKRLLATHAVALH